MRKVSLQDIASPNPSPDAQKALDRAVEASMDEQNRVRGTTMIIREVLEDIWNSSMQKESGSDWNKKEIDEAERQLELIMLEAKIDMISWCQSRNNDRELMRRWRELEGEAQKLKLTEKGGVGMREIKFRFWDGTTGNKVMCHQDEYGYFVYSSGFQVSFHQAWFEANDNEGYNKPKALMQYTGLKDKNGVEIYEGDIVAIAFWNGVDMADIENGVIKWQKESSAFKWFSGEPSDANNYWLSHADSKHREIIGNIYENPELLAPKPDIKERKD